MCAIKDPSMKTNLYAQKWSLLSLVFCFSLVGCQQDDFFEKEFLENSFNAPDVLVDKPSELPPTDGTSPGPVTDPTPTEPPAKDLVCDPFGYDDEATSNKFGIHAKLYDASSFPGRIQKLADVIQDKYVLPSDLYFSRLNVTPRNFSEGFSGPDNEPLKNASGDTLYEWFGLRFTGRFALTSMEEAGYYELVTHSDDGTIVRVNANGETREILNDDGEHAPRVGCAKEYIYLDADSKLNFEIDYFQGPRYQISMVLYWRKVASTPQELSQVKKSSMCGKESTASSVNKLLDEGFTKLQPDNFLLPAQIVSNPCAK